MARGSVFGVSAGSSFLGWVHAQRGALRDAEAELRVGFGLAVEHDLTFALPSIFMYARDVMPERPGLEDVAALVERIELPVTFAETVSGALHLDARSRLRLARGDTAAAIADLRRCGEIFDAVHLTSPVMSAWRSTLALALRRDRTGAGGAAGGRGARSRSRQGLPRAVGVATRAAGLLAGGEPGIELLSDAVATLEGSPSRLEHARALTELGGALRRAGRRAEAREQLGEGLELARDCGAGAARRVGRGRAPGSGGEAPPAGVQRRGVVDRVASDGSPRWPPAD